MKKKRELSYFLLKNNAFIHRLPQSGPRKETPSLSRLTFPATRNHMGRAILEIQAAYNKKKGAASSEESEPLASEIAGTLHPRGRFLSLARALQSNEIHVEVAYRQRQLKCLSLIPAGESLPPRTRRPAPARGCETPVHCRQLLPFEVLL